MIKIDFTEEEVAELESERLHYPNPKVQKKIEAIYLKSHNLPHKLISKICNISSVTLSSYLKQYSDGGIEHLKINLHKGRKNQLKEHRQTLEEYFTENPPHSTKEAAKVIEEKTGIKRGLTQVREFLKKHKFKYRKTAIVPGKAINKEFINEQELFKKEELEPVLDEGKNGRREVFLWMPPTSYTSLS